jgi:hypothetical protein
MTTLRIAALALLALLLGWLAIEFTGSRQPSARPPGGEPAHSAGVDRPGSDPRVLEGDSGGSAAREHAEPGDDPWPIAIVLVRVRERASGPGVEGAAIAVGASSSVAQEVLRGGLLGNPPGETDARTDELGEARIEVPSGIPLRLRVREPGPGAARTDVAVPPLGAGEHRELEVILPRGVDLDHWIRATSASDGHPVAQATVRLRLANASLAAEAAMGGNDPESDGEAHRTAVTDDDGLARVHRPSRRAAFACVDAPGFGSRIAALIPGHDAPERAQVLALPRAAAVMVTVTSSTGVALANATVVLTTPASEIATPRGATGSGEDPVRSASTDSEGTCRVVDLSPGVPIRAEVWRGNERLHRVADPWIFAPGEEASRAVSLAGAARLVGVLVGADAMPLPDALLWLARGDAGSSPAPSSAARYFCIGTLEQPFSTTRTDEAGAFVFEGLEAGTWWVGPAPSRGASSDSASSDAVPRAVLVRVPPGSQRVEIVLRAARARWFRGRVVDPDDVPVAQTSVEASGVETGGVPLTRTAADGSFALGPLADEPFRVRARGRWGLADSEEIRATPGGPELVLRLRRGVSLRGRALDLGSGAPCVATLRLVHAGDGSGAALAASGRDGTFEMRGLAPGTYDLVARTEDGRTGVLRGIAVTSQARLSPVLVTLAPGIRLRLRNAGAGPPGRYTVLVDGLALAEGLLHVGASAVVQLPAGPATVRFERPGHPVERHEVPGAVAGARGGPADAHGAAQGADGIEVVLGSP